MQDATAQMALLQFMHAGRKTTAVPSTVHCDHLIQAKVGSSDDLLRAKDENKEVYDFLESISKKYSIGLETQCRNIHSVFLRIIVSRAEIGTDSHTPNAGGLGIDRVAALNVVD